MTALYAWWCGLSVTEKTEILGLVIAAVNLLK